MSGLFSPVKVTDRVFWVGAIDWNLPEFHGYATPNGTTYNAYLVTGEKNVLVDTVKAPFKDEMLSRIREVMNPEKIDYIISNHSEMDHSGCLPETIEIVKPEKVFASEKGVEALRAHFHTAHEFTAVKDGEKRELGDLTFHFIETRMLHWPDSMVTYFPAENLLFAQDGFAMHYASSERFDDMLDDNVLEWEAQKYYANILMPFSPLIKKLLKKIKESGIKIDILATDHGPIWRSKIEKIFSLYDKWADQKPTKKAVITYDTMWHSTEKMAAVIGDGLAGEGIVVKNMALSTAHRSDVATEVLDAGALIVGSPTINNGIFPTVADVLTYLRGLRPKNLIGAAFGSYGWSGEGPKQLETILQDMKVEIAAAPVTVQYVPDEEALRRCADLGRVVARRLKEVCETEA